jgi:hypothetical protein
VSDFTLRAIPVSKSIPLVQFLNLSNLRSQTPDLFSKNFKVIHTIRIVPSGIVCVGRQSVREVRTDAFILAA